MFLENLFQVIPFDSVVELSQIWSNFVSRIFWQMNGNWPAADKQSRVRELIILFVICCVDRCGSWVVASSFKAVCIQQQQRRASVSARCNRQLLCCCLFDRFCLLVTSETDAVWYNLNICKPVDPTSDPLCYVNHLCILQFLLLELRAK